MAEAVDNSVDAKSVYSTLEEEKNCKLTCYFRDLLKHGIKFQIPSKEAIDIIQSVGILVETLVAKVTSTVMWLPIVRLLPVGSMAEKTSVIFPDEFDYLVVLEQKGLDITRCSKGNKGYVHLKVIDHDQNFTWRKWTKEGFLMGAFTRDSSLVPSAYFDTLQNAFMQEIATVIRTSEEELTQHTDTGTLRVDKNVAKHGPALTPYFVWESRYRNRKTEIKVDMTLAFEVCLTPDIICEEDTFHPKIWKKVKEIGKCMFIPCHEKWVPGFCDWCYRLTFTEAEVKLVQALSQNHKDCYKLLKYIFNSGNGPIYFSSYVWKTLVLKHDCYCKENENLAFCFKVLIADCLHYLFNRTHTQNVDIGFLVRIFMPGEKFELNIPSIFIKDHNILHKKNFLLPCEQYLQSIERMLQSLEDISGAENPDMGNIKIVNGLMTALKAYVKSLPVGDTCIENCKKCYGTYFINEISETRH